MNHIRFLLTLFICPAVDWLLFSFIKLKYVGQFFIRLFFARFVCILPHLICFCNSILSQYYMCLQICAICFQFVTYEKSRKTRCCALQRNQFPEVPTNSTLLWHFREEISISGEVSVRIRIRIWIRIRFGVSESSEWIMPTVEVCVSDKWNIIHKIIEFPCGAYMCPLQWFTLIKKCIHNTLYGIQLTDSL